MIIAIKIIMAFSINVAKVIGNFKTEPRHAQVISCLESKDLVTPTVLIPRTSIVIQRLNRIPILNKNKSPKVTSIKG